MPLVQGMGFVAARRIKTLKRKLQRELNRTARQSSIDKQMLVFYWPTRCGNLKTMTKCSCLKEYMRIRSDLVLRHWDLIEVALRLGATESK